jgi:hypothetical protein
MPSKYVINIPRSHWGAIDSFLAVPIDALQLLSQCITASEPTPDLEDLVELCAPAAELPSDAVEDVLAVALHLLRLRRGMALPVDDVLEAVAESLAHSGFPEWEAKRQQWNERLPVLGNLLDWDSILDLMSKARELLYEFQCVMAGTAVLTDVRYVFDHEGAHIRGGLVLHTLSIDYQEGREPRQLHITMSNPDIDELIGQLERAKRKSQVATESMQLLRVPDLTPKRNL